MEVDIWLKEKGSYSFSYSEQGECPFSSNSRSSSLAVLKSLIYAMCLSNKCTDNLYMTYPCIQIIVQYLM